MEFKGEQSLFGEKEILGRANLPVEMKLLALNAALEAARAQEPGESLFVEISRAMAGVTEDPY